MAADVLGGDRRASVSRELTKKFEHTERGTLDELVDWAQSEPKGEMVLVIAGAAKSKASAEDVVGDVLKLVAAGMRLKEAVAEIAEQNSVSKSVLYQLALDAKQ